MDNHMDRQTAIDKAEHCNRLVKDELLIEAFESVEADIYNEWRTSAVGDYQYRSDLFHTLKGLERLKARLQKYIDDGVIASRS
jgi:hypothetical protein